MLKIDVFNHILPPRHFKRMNEVAPGLEDIGKRPRNILGLVDRTSACAWWSSVPAAGKVQEV